jgi:hypothetical protein
MDTDSHINPVLVIGTCDNYKYRHPQTKGCINWTPEPPSALSAAEFTAKEFEAELWTVQDPQDKYSFAEAYAANLREKLSTAERRIKELEKLIAK